jgi:uncharacterized alkaline shock family protein YloU
MNAFNRIVVVVLLVVLTVLCCALSVGAKWIVPPAADQMTMWAEGLEDAGPLTTVGVGAAIGLAPVLVLVFLFILEVRPRRRRFIRAEKSTGGQVEVSILSIADRLRHEVNGLPGVLSVKPKVSGRRRGVEVRLDVDIAAGLDVPPQAEQVVETVRQVVEEKMGLKMATLPKVHVRTVPYPKTPVMKSRPSAPEPEPEPEEPKEVAPLVYTLPEPLGEPLELEEPSPELPEEEEE